MIQIGDIEIHYVSDGIVHVDAGGPFGLVPRSLYHSFLEPDADNLIPMTLHCLLVRTAGKTIVIDTGLGDKMSEKLRQNWGLIRPQGGLLDGLARLGVGPNDVDLVIDTHLHGDHCAGNTQLIGDGQKVKATFPRAEYVTQRREYEDAMQPNERTRATYLPFNYQPLVESGQMRLLDGDTQIMPGIRGVVTPGHTPAHMSILFESGGRQAMFIADLAPYTIHFERLQYITAYDVLPLVTLESKRVWQQWAVETGALLLFQHDPKTRAGCAVREGERVRIEPLEVPLA